MQFDSICLEDNCRIDHKQLFYSRNHDSQVHFDQKHVIEPIYYGSLFFRSIKTEPIKFSQSLEKTRSQLQKKYLWSIELMKSIVKAKFQQCLKGIRDIYELENKEFSFDLFEPHLQKETSKTEFYLTLINWKKAHPSENIQKYIQNIPEIYVDDYAKDMNSFAESLLSNKHKKSNDLHQRGDQPKTKEPQPDVDDNDNQRLLQQLTKPMKGIYDHHIKFQLKSALDKQPSKSKRKHEPRNKEILMELANVFCNSQTELKHKDIKSPLLNNLPNRKIFQSYIESLMNRVCLNIEHYIKKELEFRKMSARDRARIWTDLKNYRSWMDKQEADIFIRCVRFFMNLDQTIQIRSYEIYVLYVLIMIRVIQKMAKKKTELTYNTSPKNLKKEMVYLYVHYDNYNKVKDLLVARYPYEKNLTDGQYLVYTFKEIMINTYHRLKEREAIENARFQKAINEEIDFSGELWSPVVRKYIEYQIHEKVDSSERIELEAIMKATLNKQQIKLRNNQPLIHEEGNNQAIERAFNKFKEPPIINLEEKDSTFSTLFNVKNKEVRNSQFPKIVKTEQISYSGSQYEFDNEQKDE